MSILKIIDKVVLDAAEEYLKREIRATHPDGSFDNARRWYPSDGEKCNACSRIREPSRAYPYSIMTHCRSIVHVANKYQVDVSILRKISGQVLRSVKKGLELSVLEAADIVVDENKNFSIKKESFNEDCASQYRTYTAEQILKGGS